VERTFGQRPQQVAADSAYNSGPTLGALEQRGVEAYIPVSLASASDPSNPAVRPDPSQPVPPEAWDRLPRSTRGKKRATLDRSAFVYDEDADCYWCPMGRRLHFTDVQRRQHEDRPVVQVRRYRCPSCADCALSDACRGGATPRCIQHDEYEEVRRRTHARMSTEAGQATYGRRNWLCETPFGLIKTVMNFRQFLLRGLKKVKTEWLWACTAYNLRKLVSDVQRLRGKVVAALV
jgi:hypothetical protein